MIFERHFTLAVSWRVFAIVGLAAAIFVITRSLESFAATVTVLAGLAVLFFVDILRIVRRTNDEVARLIEALRHRDLSRQFSPRYVDHGFAELAQQMHALIDELLAESRASAAEARHRADLIEQVPIPILLVSTEHDDAMVEMANRAARRFFSHAHNAGTRTEDFAHYGPALSAMLRGDSSMTAVQLTPPNEAPLTMRVSTASLTHRGGTWRMVALQQIQSELDHAEQMLARDLVRVLTHEIMNSLTPVVSMADSAATLAKALPPSASADELRGAVETVARRSAGLMDFVSRYRAVTAMPKLAVSVAPLATLLEELQRLFAAEWQVAGIALSVDAQNAPSSAEIDPALFSQVVLNLLRNAAQAVAANKDAKQVLLSIGQTPSGRLSLNVDDNGPGINADHTRDVFLPFYTTKPDGTGVGLSFARQVVLAHGGSIHVERSPLGGARFCLVL